MNQQFLRLKTVNGEVSQPSRFTNIKSPARRLRAIVSLTIVVALLSVGATAERAQVKDSVSTSADTQAANLVAVITGFKGPVFPPPGFQASNFSSSGPGPGFTGGRTFTYSTFDLNPTKELYWGIQAGQVKLDMGGDGFTANEIMTYQPGSSNLAQGLVVFAGTSQYCSAFSGVITINTSMQLHVTDLSNNPLALSTTPAINGAEQPVLNVPATGFKANFVLLANGQPYLEFRNANNGCSGFVSSGSVTFGFWFTAYVNSDFDNDGKADVSVWNPDNHNWYIIQSSDGTTRTQVDWGNRLLGDIAVPGDYDGDFKTDVAIYRPSEGNWYIIQSATNTIRIQGWGLSTDIPVQGDYDGDGKTDIAVWRPTEGNWYIIQSSGGGTVRNWGISGDKPVQADYDGDGKTDIAVWRPSEGNWYIIQSTGGGIARNWGLSTDKPVQADYDSDGKADIAIYRPTEGNWYIINSLTGTVTLRGWGSSTDKPVPADYDGDGKVDIAVWRPNEGKWYIIKSSTNSGQSVYLGNFSDVPVPSAYIPQ